MTEEKTEVHTISMYPDDWRDIRDVATKTGVNSLSGALRIIMQQWRESRAALRSGERREGQPPHRL